MDNSASPTVVAAFSTVTATDPTRPLITFYDDATGERTELSGASLGNWVAKTANLLVDGLGLGTGDVAAVALPAHWQTAAVLLGCWSAGLAVSLADGRGSVGFGTGDSAPLLRTDETYALSLAPMALPFRPGPPPGTQDYAVEVRGYGDHFRGPVVPPSQRALAPEGGASLSHAELMAAAMKLSAPRVLIDGDLHPDPLTWLIAPLAAGATIVLCRNVDPARLAARLATEHATPLSPRS
jgi:uncharacterized protein (TIGR03089 family)